MNKYARSSQLSITIHACCNTYTFPTKQSAIQQSTIQQINQSTIQPLNQSTIQQINQSTIQLINQLLCWHLNCICPVQVAEPIKESKLFIGDSLERPS
jgi:hypothetical protein